MKQYHVLVSDEARTMLRKHVQFLATLNPDAAERLRETLISGIRSLTTMPERCPYLDSENRRSPYRKLIIPSSYLVVYLVDGDTVYVEYILDCRQDYRWLLR